MGKLSKNDIINSLKGLDGWKQDSNTIINEYVFEDFSSAIAFIVKIGIEAEKMDHHPDLNLYSWNKVKVTLSTHSSGGITEKDLELAKLINNLI